MTKKFRFPSTLRFMVVVTLLFSGISYCQVADSCLLPFQRDGLYGYIDYKGNIRIPPTFVYAGYFYEGRAVAYPQNPNKSRCMIDTSGNCSFYYLSCRGDGFSEGIMPVMLDNAYVYVDINGKIVFSPPSSGILPYANSKPEYKSFKDGRSRVSLLGYWNDSLCFVHGYLDHQGRFAIPMKFIDAEDFSEGLACVKYQPGKRKEILHLYIDTLGNEVLKVKYDETFSFHDGMALVVKGKYPDRKWGFINKKGELVVQCLYNDGTDHFSQGLAQVIQDGKSFFIDKSGRQVFAADFEFCGRFNNGLCRVKRNNKWGYIDMTGKLVIPLQYDIAFDFLHGVAWVRSKDTYSYIYTNGTSFFSYTVPMK